MTKMQDQGIGIENAGTKAPELAFQACLTEYESLCAEIRQGRNSELQILQYGIITTGAGIPITLGLIGQGYDFVLLVVPLIFTSLMLSSLHYIRLMFERAAYINHHLRPQADRILRQLSPTDLEVGEVLSWEDRTTAERRDPLGLYRRFGFLPVARYIILALPNMASLIGFVVLKAAQQGVWGVWEIAWFAADIGIVIFPLIVALTMYRALFRVTLHQASR